MPATLEAGINRELKWANYRKLVSVGPRLIQSADLNYPDHIQVGQITLTNGRIIYPTLNIWLQATPLTSILDLTDDGLMIAGYELLGPFDHSNMGLFNFSITTYVGEGSGIGSAMFELGQIMIARYISLSGTKTKFDRVFVYGEDTSHRSSNPHKKIEWTSQLMDEHGYTDNKPLKRFLSLDYKTRRIMIKEV
ncbi:hypothetical protein A2774_04060 [Candidatus Roizmanbacteria bacterium RIFCSPHIGHO2_01_FULL_39_12c]|uniref:Uncharacterized protein n=1 Tax=Candidatus Roizmanbacteria bacterium RIFCSPHIGHO2_01_FULL_39_12c TaxID=1802031 RepID=A0A1F7GEN9_9BACT|nr:MAG: hypothetical protein A2774_04060 [Candidatus Roizmanbacteria bacterium RIFCSPHIGHO2_01_FULL_39_12c]OGK48071.1 MAG: hypothetical protein A2963_03875 [Candidatus Roizmanbacteria bacterium RIFCSPLOWO2_01_FULL_40_13]